MKARTTICGNFITCMLDAPDAPRSGRLGSVPLYFKDGRKAMVRVYGRTPEFKSMEDYDVFASQVIRFLSAPTTTQTLFGAIETVLAKRFNYSQAMRNIQAGNSLKESIDVRSN